MKTIVNKVIIVLILFLTFNLYLICEEIIPSDFVPVDKCNYGEQVEMLRNTKLNVGDRILSSNRPDLPESYTSPEGNFVIHYTTSGVDAVSTEDNDGNGIPDYVDSAAIFFDHVYQVEVVEMGYKSPIDDRGGGGTAVYDIYIVQLGDKGVYGQTFPEEIFYKDNMVIRTTSFIKVDNNFSPTDSTMSNGQLRPSYPPTSYSYNGLKITAAHEFHHAIQNFYGSPNLTNPSITALNEMTSTWMEYRLYPEVKDYFQYLPGLFSEIRRYPLGDGSSSFAGYRWSIFWQYVSSEYGEEVNRRMWEIFGDGLRGYHALDSAFKEKGSSLKDACCNLIPWMYFTGKRAVEGRYFNNARLFPMLKFHRETYFSPPETSDMGRLDPYEFRGYRYFLPDGEANSLDTADIILLSTDTEAAIYQSQDTRLFEIIFSNSKIDDSMVIPGKSISFFIDRPDGDICFEHYLPTVNDCPPYPNPFITNVHDVINFCIPFETSYGDKVALTVYNENFISIFSEKLQVQNDNNARVIRWNNFPSNFSSGVYIYSLEFNGKKKMGKFAVRKK